MRRLGALCALVVALAAGCGAPEAVDVSLASPADEVDAVSGALSVCAEGPTVEGIDVSRFQGTVDWQKVAGAGKKFAYIQVARGLSPDDFFDYNWAEAKANGLLRGAYIRFFPDQDLVGQADLLIGAGPYPAGELPPMLDIEDHADLAPAALAAKISELVRRVKEGTGRIPVIYTGYYFWKDRIASSRSHAENPLFIANYSTNCPLVPQPWNRWLIHQYSSEGRLAAVTVNTVDLNRFNGSLDALRAWAATQAPLPGAPVPGTKPTGTLTGAIYAQGRPSARIADATVTVAGQGEQRTGPDGLYRLQLPAGTYTATVSKPGFHGVSVTRTVKAGAVVWGSMELTPSDQPLPQPPDVGLARLSGLVTHAGTGEHLPDVTLSLRHENGQTLVTTRSDSEGAFELASPAAPLEATLLAHAEGFAPVSLPVSLEAGARVVMDVTLRPLDMGALASLKDRQEASVVKPEPVTGCSAAPGMWLGSLLLLLPLGRAARRSARR